MEIRLIEDGDCISTLAIHNHYVTQTTVTFALEPRTESEHLDWIREHLGAHPAVVAIDDAGVIGFGSLTKFRPRPAYNTTVEDSVYVAPDQLGKGAGRAILERLCELASEYGYHSLIARITGQNDASIALHRACGFELVGIEREVGRKHQQWLDVVEMQRLLGAD